ncbi:DUF2000 domain-containing protein [Actinocrinis sp.]|uniref:DUF2000 domain-containing protein n=1 Tax=Actinocrinis sp. TaxID=1920516 RepID=UPI002DDD59BF|nr:DUF2000 domain-containing protein [Actinocrinis sp.]
MNGDETIIDTNSANSVSDTKTGNTKIAVVVREDLAVWQKLNVTAFAVSGIAATASQTVGEPYVDASDTRYLPMFGQPVLVFAGTAAQLRKAHRRALERGLAIAVYPEELFGTFNDEDNRAVVRKTATEDLSLAGMSVFGTRADVDGALKGLSLHR